jgi:hypothetical protein
MTEKGINCLTIDTTVLTSTGYKNIITLKEGDYVITSNYKKSQIKKINEYTCYPSKINNPYIIKKGQISINYPPEDIKLSGGHAILYKDNWILPKLFPKFKQDNFQRVIKYYHLELENYITDNLVINNGAIVESFGDLNNEDYLKERNKRTELNANRKII